MLISKQCAVKKLADLGKPGTHNHAVDVEIKVPRRQAFRAIVPFLIFSLMMGSKDPSE